MWVFNEPAVGCVFHCCSTVCWGDLNRQSKDNREEKNPPGTSTLHNLANKKAAVIDKARPCPWSTAEYGFDLNQICFTESQKAKSPLKTFFWLCCCQKTSLRRLLKQPGYCLCVWSTGLCQLFNQRSQQHDHTVVGKQGIGSHRLTSRRTDVGRPLLGSKQTTVTLHHPLAPAHTSTHTRFNRTRARSYIF